MLAPALRIGEKSSSGVSPAGTRGRMPKSVRRLAFEVRRWPRKGAPRRVCLEVSKTIDSILTDRRLQWCVFARLPAQRFLRKWLSPRYFYGLKTGAINRSIIPPQTE